MDADYTVEGVAAIPTPGGYSWKEVEAGQNNGVPFHTLECSKPNSDTAIGLSVVRRAPMGDDDRLAILEGQYGVVIESLRKQGFTGGFGAGRTFGEPPIPDVVRYAIQATDSATGDVIEFRVATRFGKRNFFCAQAAAADAAEADWLIDVAQGIVEWEPPSQSENLASAAATDSAPTPAPPALPASTTSSQPSEPPPDPPFDGEVIKLGAPAIDAVIGGAGRFLVLHLTGKNEAAVVDLPGRMIAFSVPAPEGALLAAGKQRLYVVTPSDKQVKCWSLLDGQPQGSGQIDVAGQPTAIAVGFDSAGPMLVHWADEFDGRYSLVDTQTWAARQISPDRSGLAPGQVAFYNTDKTGIAVRASADGRVFTTRNSYSPRPSERLFIGRTLVTNLAEGGFGHAIPSADGAIVCRSSGLFSSNGQWRGYTDNRACYATCDPRFILTSTEEGFFVRDAKTGAELHTLPPLVEFGRDQFIKPYDQTKLASDQRIFCIPAANLLITIPNSDDRLLLREIPFNTIVARDALQIDPARPDLATFYTPGAISRAVSGGGGRFLVLHLAEKGEAAVFDLTQRKIVGAVPAPADALIAAGLERLIVINPGDQQVSRWSLETLQAEASQELDWEGLGVPRVASMGPASPGPVVIQWTNEQGGAFSLLDVESLSLRPLSKSQPGQKIGGDVAIQTTGSKWGEVAVRSSYDGQAFGIWQTSGSSGIEILKLGKSPSARYESKSHGHVLPTAQGRVLTGHGSYDAKFKFENNRGAYFLTSDPRYAVRVTEEGGAIEEIGAGATLATLPVLEEMRKEFVNYCRIGKDFGKLRLMHDQRVFCLLTEQLLVTIPETDDRLVLRKLTFEAPAPAPQAVAESAPRPAAEVEPQEPVASGDTRRRLWTDKSGKFKILARLTSVGGGNVTLEKTDGATVTVPLDKLSDADQEYVQKLGLRP
jgi:hypothetical protein